MTAEWNDDLMIMRHMPDVGALELQQQEAAARKMSQPFAQFVVVFVHCVL